MLSEPYIQRIEFAAEDQGIEAVVAVLARWAEEEGGLSFVQRIVAGMTQAEVDELVPEEEEGEEGEG